MIKKAQKAVDKAKTDETKQKAKSALQKAKRALETAQVPKKVQDILASGKVGLRSRVVGGRKPKGFEGTRTIFEDLDD